MVPEYVLPALDACSPGCARPPRPKRSIAGLPDQVRGYEHLKLERAQVYRAELERRLARFEAT